MDINSNRRSNGICHVLNTFISKLLNGIVACRNISDPNVLIQYDKVNLDKDFALILLNNGCAFSDNAYTKELIISTEKKYYLDLVIGGTGNSKNRFFDMFDYFDEKHLVVFLDELKIINYEDDKDKPFMIGNSQVIYSIKKIIELFMLSYYGSYMFSGEFIGTAYDSMIRYIPTIAACMLVHYFNPLTIHDTEGLPIPHNEIMLYIYGKDNISLEDVFLSIRKRTL